MESNMKALEVVCMHFQSEYGDENLRKLRRRLNTAHVQNHRLRMRLNETEKRLTFEESRCKILSHIINDLINRMDTLQFDSGDQILGG